MDTEHNAGEDQAGLLGENTHSLLKPLLTRRCELEQRLQRLYLEVLPADQPKAEAAAREELAEIEAQIVETVNRLGRLNK